MLRPPSPHLALGLGLLALVACGESDTPTQPPDRVRASSRAGRHPGLEQLDPEGPLPDPARGRTVILLGGPPNLPAAVVNNSAGQPIVYTIGAIDDEDCCEVPVGRVQRRYRCLELCGAGAGRGPWCTTPMGWQTSGASSTSPVVTTRAAAWCRSRLATSVYDPVANTLTQKADMPKGTADGVSAVIGGQLYVLPGICLTDNNRRPGFCETAAVPVRLLRYNPATDHWVSKKPGSALPPERGRGRDRREVLRCRG